MDDAARHLVNCLANSETPITTLIQHESQKTTRAIERLEQIRIDDSFYQEVKKSLFFHDISRRQEHIEHEFDGFEDSIDWIFEGFTSNGSPLPQTPQRTTKPKWNSFVDWLRTSVGVYWINGKAGSGKSTLMHCISDDLRTIALLEYWAGNKKLLTPTFFFWNSGSPLQRNVEGMLRSLIYQMVVKCPQLISCIKVEVCAVGNVQGFR